MASLVSSLAGKKVLIAGGVGTIGRGLARSLVSARTASSFPPPPTHHSHSTTAELPQKSRRDSHKDHARTHDRRRHAARAHHHHATIATRATHVMIQLQSGAIVVVNSRSQVAHRRRHSRHSRHSRVALTTTSPQRQPNHSNHSRPPAHSPTLTNPQRKLDQLYEDLGRPERLIMINGAQHMRNSTQSNLMQLGAQPHPTPHDHRDNDALWRGGDHERGLQAC